MRVEVAEGAGPFARMLGGLLGANIQSDPAKGALAGRTTGTIGFVVTDTDEEVLMRLGGGAIHLAEGPVAVSDLRVVGSAEVIMALSTVPLRFGLPDPLSATGRGVTGRWIGGSIEVHGLPRQAPLLRTLLRLTNVRS